MCHHSTARHPDLFVVTLWAIAALSAAVPTIATETSTPTAEPSLWALELGVSDVERAIGFYTSALGFEVEASESTEAWTLLGNGSARLALALSGLPVVEGDSARAYPNFTVGDLDTASEAVVAAGGSVEESFDSAVGRAVRYLDPFGHPGHLIDHPWDDLGAEVAPAVFNVALNVVDVEASERFYTALGFEVSTRDYLPQTLVFKPRGSAQLILHPSGERATGPGSEAAALMIETDPIQALSSLAQGVEGRTTVERTTPASMIGGASIDLRDPSGILLKLRRQTPVGPTIEASLSTEQAAQAFERLKGLAGKWQAKSSKGWNEVVGYEIVAGGSVVVESNTFKDSPESTMYTMFHLDGERLLATHYCGSGNQPRLIASAVSDDGQVLTFTYLDATGIPSRDHGHMDQAVFRFLDDGRFSARWTWYQKGAEQWLEEIEHRRLATVETEGTAESAAAAP